ncbi:hypothetical protein KFO32_05850 [Pantoea ananatis]|uniref:hypothetical protein n=1 Tax=Pantoea ananas TaxID=553 RepID=UPI001FF56547|nr:hypothetical protein [Pantoea ananatis]MCK0552599.1 hypothetical protein [Pantoea ananatis]
MSLFQTIHYEKNELVEFELLLSEIAIQENITFSEACAIIAREASDHSGDIPFSFNEPFYLYDYNIISGFVKSEDFSQQSISFLKSMALGEEYAEDCSPGHKGVYCRIDGGNGWYHKFYFKGTELTVSLLSANVNIPPCLEKYRKKAESRLKAKLEREEKNSQDKKEVVVTIDSLKEQVATLKKELLDAAKKIPSMLCDFRDDDPLYIAIQMRNSEWSKYNVDDRKTIPSQEALVAQLKEQYKYMPEVQARAIEKVACPIKRK